MEFLCGRIRIVLLLFLNMYMLESQVVPQSNCRVFEYRFDDRGIYGFVEVKLDSYVTSVLTIVNFTVATSLPSEYVGTLEYLGLQHTGGSSTVKYKIHFPVQRPVPRLTAVVVNNNILCQAPGDVPGPGGYVSTIGLQHMVALEGDRFGSSQGRPVSSMFPLIIPTNNDNSMTIGDFDLGTFERPSFNNFPKRPPVRTPPRRPQPVFSVPPVYTEPPAVYTEPPAVYTDPPVRQTQRTPRPRPTPRPTVAPVADKNNICGTVGGAAALIYDGVNYDRGEWPWLVAIYKSEGSQLKYVCAGTLVSQLHVVTAAHCMKQRSSFTKKNDLWVRVGVFDLGDWDDDETSLRNVADAHMHEKYNPANYANDILILTFTKKVDYSLYIRPICLWTGPPELEKVVDKTGVVTGWGKSETGAAGQGTPKKVDLPIVSTDDCRNSHAGFAELTSETTLCAGYRNGSGPCFGDSGSGMYLHSSGRWRLRGIVSSSLRQENGENTCNLNEFIIFTDTAQYLPWMNNYLDVKR
ncbi:hypothetical protein JYU34_011842 [Plutella xylostella]|uniref:Peptidase S1 domain-containing protein n=1 Tax=Plutella xylostella TaxID=51655 RepID=A0ABQ7QDR2_PLUXY|nr:hypothetical protein JYU34_011842 [Plutella xylostella]